MNDKKNRVGLGTFPFAGVFTPISKQQVKKIVRQFIENGGYYIDTAPLYGFGEVEVWLGEALKSLPRESYSISTKCGYVDVEGKSFKTVKKSAKFEDIIRECERSLQRLRLDHIDLYFVHWPDPNTPFEETMNALSKLKKDGKIRKIGVSNVSLETLTQYNKSGDVSCVQNRFSLLNRSISAEFAKYMERHAIKLVPYRVIDRGLLTGKIFEFKIDGDPKDKTIIVDWIKNFLAPTAQQLHITLGQLAIAWVLHHKFVDFVLVGVTNPKYLKVNLRSDEITLTKESISKIEAAYKDLEHTVRPRSIFSKSGKIFLGPK